MKEKEKPDRREISEKDRDEKTPGKMKKLLKKLEPLKEKLLVVSAAVIISACTTQFNAKDSNTGDSTDSLDPEITEISESIDFHEDSSTADVSEEDSVIGCEPFNEVKTVWIEIDNNETVGGIDVLYKEFDGEHAIFDLLCEGETIIENLTVASDSEITENIAEYSFNIRIRVNTMDATRCNAEIEVSV